MSNQGKIELVPLDGNLEIVLLPDLTDIVIGRNALTKIQDIHCSKTQLTLKADYSNNVVKVTRNGLSASLLDGAVLNKNETKEAKDQMILEVLPNKLKYKLVFSLPNKITVPRKRMASIEHTEGLKKQCFKFHWQSFKHTQFPSQNSLLVCETKMESRISTNKVAAFDLDSTIIKTLSGNVFPKNKDDWTLWHPNVKTALTKLHNDGVKLVIFTNQASLRMEVNTDNFRTKIENILSTLNLPICVYVARLHDIFRKPAPGMWDLLNSEIIGGIDKTQSFYVGDAAGRLKNWAPGKKKDFSMVDRLFAKNIGIPFFTPEEYFLNQNGVPYNKLLFDPTTLVIPPLQYYDLPSATMEGIIMVGCPGSGKSHFIKNNIIPYNYKHISQDIHKTWAKCENLMLTCLKEKQRFVIDNTNPTREKREKIVQICKKHNASVRCFVMGTPKYHCLHNNRFREITGDMHAVVRPEIIMGFWRTFEKPCTDEGYSELLDIPFYPSFESEELKKLYFMHLMEYK